MYATYITHIIINNYYNVMSIVSDQCRIQRKIQNIKRRKKSQN